MASRQCGGRSPCWVLTVEADALDAAKLAAAAAAAQAQGVRSSVIRAGDFLGDARGRDRTSHGHPPGQWPLHADGRWAAGEPSARLARLAQNLNSPRRLTVVKLRAEVSLNSLPAGAPLASAKTVVLPVS